MTAYRSRDFEHHVAVKDRATSMRRLEELTSRLNNTVDGVAILFSINLSVEFARCYGREL
jgi:hypothetical protein